MRAEIKKWGINGEGIAYVNRKPVFIPGVIPGEEVEFSIVEDHSTYAVGQLDRIVTKSARRRYPLCKKWKECGGCSLMHVQSKAQAKMKEQLVKEALRKYAKYRGPVLPILKNLNPLAYRNSCKLPFGYVDGRIATGMYEKDSRTFVELDRCYVHSKGVERVRQALMDIMNTMDVSVYNDKKKMGFRTLVIKEFDEKVQIIFVTGQGEIPEQLVQKSSELEGVVSIWQSIKTEDTIDVFGSEMVHLYGDEKIEVQMDGVDCSLLPKSFFQLNTEQAKQLYGLVAEWTPKSKHIVEAYCGIGVMSLLVSSKAQRVTGIEYIQDAIDNAKENAQRNGCVNVDFICGDAGKELQKIYGSVDTLIVDPPRSGLNNVMKDAIMASKIQTIVYVSCNPSTLGKDLGVLSKRYTIEKVQPVDMFSQTPHVECVCLMSKVQK